MEALTRTTDPRTYMGDELASIHMPIGGILAGQIYLNGDGSLGHWDVMNVRSFGDNPLLKQFPNPERILQQGFSVRLNDSSGNKKVFPLNAKTFPKTKFTAEYPAGIVDYLGGQSPVEITLEGVAPFVPLDVPNSSIPAAFIRLAVKNTSCHEVRGDIQGWLENGVAAHSGGEGEGVRLSTVRVLPGALAIEFSASPIVKHERTPELPTLILADFEATDYAGWKTTGTAFGDSPVPYSELEEMPHNPTGSACASSFHGGPEARGTLESPEFVIDRKILRIWSARGGKPLEFKVELQIEGVSVRQCAGSGGIGFEVTQWDIREYAGKMGRILITDSSADDGILIDRIELCDGSLGVLEARPDFGTMAFVLLDPVAGAVAEPSVRGDLAEGGPHQIGPTTMPFGHPQVGMLSSPFSLGAGESRMFTFAVVWHFPNLQLVEWGKLQGSGRWYASRFAGAPDIVEELAAAGLDILRTTNLWRKTWYNSTLPRWVLDRTIANVSTLATNTCFRFRDGRFYGFEGVHSFIGTCNHVWHYEESVGRLFPELEMSLRAQADFVPAVGIKSDGSIPMRIDGQAGSLDPLLEQPALFGTDYQHWPSIDGQCGIILRSYRCHLTSSSSEFVKAYWPQIRLATQWLFAQDSDGDNLPDRVTHHTLDEDIAGPSPWISSMWLAAVAAAEKMALLAGDEIFATECAVRLREGQKNFVTKLWNNDHFIHLSPEEDKWRPGCYDGIHIDQVLGQQWAWRNGLGRVLPATETRAALASIYRNNFFEDVSYYYAKLENKPSRAFSVAGNAGTVVATWPEGSCRPDGSVVGREWQSEHRFHQGFYNETMSGFEHQFASHLIYEGMVAEGLKVEKAIHDRHQPNSPKRGNPFNEPEAGNHYSRAMSAYAVFLALCGFEYDGPAGRIAFDPRLGAGNFRSAFTGSEGWGSYAQKISTDEFSARFDLQFGRLILRKVAINPPFKPRSFSVLLSGQQLFASMEASIEGPVTIVFSDSITIQTESSLEVTLHQ